MVMWQKGRNHYVEPQRVNEVKEKNALTWKGYTAALLWDAPAGLWLPVVLELTESAERDMRTAYSRGQLWELRRAEQTDRRKTPVVATLRSTQGPADAPEAFHIRDVLLALYHVRAIDLSAKNPLPLRTLVSPVTLPPPEPTAAEVADKPATAAEWQRLRERAALAARPSRNGSAEHK